MFLLLTLLLTLIILVVSMIFALAVGGASMIIIFGDVFVCIAVLVFIIKQIIQKKK